MKIGEQAFRSIWTEGDEVAIIDQTKLPHELKIVHLTTLEDAARAIADMWVRGAPLIGATAAYGMALALRADPADASLATAYDTLHATRPTAINLRWALDAVRERVGRLDPGARAAAAWTLAGEIADEDVATNRRIGENGLAIIEAIARTKTPGEAVNVLTHCNAGWLATVDWGTATAPVYLAHDKGIPVHVFVDETRPRNQGAGLTAFELGHHGVDHTLVVDNAGGHLMQHGLVDLCIVGSDRTTALGDVCNKIGTYLKALAARDNGVPFYAALPASTVDWRVRDGVAEIPIEQRGGDEVSHVVGMSDRGTVERVRIAPETTPVANYAFDVTPARLVTGLITERGVCAASEAGLAGLFPELARKRA
ncbi:S-methyl-5-thioribose-1-phosphate isomerase [Jiella endophytica]|uniref:Methylthioribose-1-phosphate isomerase n=1 Tax=Jiella endophytica TaxID=2558362 RepID=A0A4Y8RTQ0_9HYPH|nr:S-methyl-5-thioribose-1-phosphate isomerase [Jiella endophytica]TFF27308.1 S-methyl-5-thioribose-1-phosphate isomerase [Jiella endophytica]